MPAALLVVADAQAVAEDGDLPDVVNCRRSSAGSTLIAMADGSRAGGGPQYQKLFAPL